MRVENEPAYVLEARPYRETSLLLELLTCSHGRLAAVARGARGEARSQRQRRAALEPFQRLNVTLSGRGEVLSLGTAESLSMPLRPIGPALFAALYVNELVQRMTGRGDPVVGLFDRYALWLEELAGRGFDIDVKGADGTSGLAWSLRRFERDLLAELGYALALDHCADSGRAIDPEADYAFDPEHGAVPWRADLPWPRVRGRTLLAWADDRQPDAQSAQALKRLARSVIRHHLGGGDLRIWHLAAQWSSS